MVSGQPVDGQADQRALQNMVVAFVVEPRSSMRQPGVQPVLADGDGDGDVVTRAPPDPVQDRRPRRASGLERATNEYGPPGMN
ncbi:hypothetical protein GCM10010172_23960 [Paractinoplanes ferrugineus]|uniref:Uncharacterized protein n=1 Tax=Paractinoplanes ferrugineus TaxID=113564 RepID=A0A919IV50_9ACTN|nr:hypothetical protein Afe05nite_05330 [Actinoplanes ferrugineus]